MLYKIISRRPVPSAHSLTETKGRTSEGIANQRVDDEVEKSPARGSKAQTSQILIAVENTMSCLNSPRDKTANPNATGRSHMLKHVPAALRLCRFPWRRGRIGKCQ